MGAPIVYGGLKQRRAKTAVGSAAESPRFGAGAPQKRCGILSCVSSPGSRNSLRLQVSRRPWPPQAPLILAA